MCTNKISIKIYIIIFFILVEKLFYQKELIEKFPHIYKEKNNIIE